MKEMQSFSGKFSLATILDVLSQEILRVKRRPTFALVKPMTRRNVT